MVTRLNCAVTKSTPCLKVYYSEKFDVLNFKDNYKVTNNRKDDILLDECFQN